jgi:hypothetical protein
MYGVTDAYKEMIISPSRKFKWSGCITTKDGKEYPFTDTDIVKWSGYITRQCSGSSEIELGTVYAAELGITLFSEVDRYSLEDASITLSFHLQLYDGTYEEVPMGVFYIAEANRAIKTLEIKAYDSMLNLDKNFSTNLSSAMPYDFLTLMAKNCHVELAQTQKEIETLTNGTELLGVYQENDIESWRDFLYYLAQAMGCFATIDRFGKLVLIPYKIDADRIVDSRHRFSSTFSDFVTRYTAVSSTNKRTETAEYYALEVDDGLTMNLGVNPLLQFGLDETRERIIKGILNAISIVEFVPFDSDTIGDPALDLGDVIRFTGGHADETKQSAITSINTKINGKQAIRCVGKNPKLAESKSKTDKNISGLINSIGETKLSVYTYTNALDISVGEEKVSIINMEFASREESNAEFHAEAIIQISSAQVERDIISQTTVEFPTIDEEGNPTTESKIISFPVKWSEDGKSELKVYYVLDGHEIEEFHPVETWHSGGHLLNLYYPIVDLEENQLHTFDVLVSISGGKATISAQDIISTITGQGLGVQQRWDGRITADDTLPSITLTVMPTNTLKAEVTSEFDTPKKKGLKDGMSSILMTGLATYIIKDNLRFFAPIVQDVVESTDKKKMTYSKFYVLDEDKFTLRKDYALSCGEDSRLNRGRMDKLVIPTTEMQFLTSIMILPFETLPFINKKVLYASNPMLTERTMISGNVIILQTEYRNRISGIDVEINRGRLAKFHIGIEDMELVENLEVENV